MNWLINMNHAWNLYAKHSFPCILTIHFIETEDNVRMLQVLSFSWCDFFFTTDAAWGGAKPLHPSAQSRSGHSCQSWDLILLKKQTLGSSLKWQELPEAIEMIFWRWCMTSHYWQGGGSMASRSRSRAFGLLSFQNSQLKLHVVSISGHGVLSSSLSCLDIP